MEKKHYSRTGRFITRIFNIRAWSDYDRTKANTVYVGRSIKNLFILRPPGQEESFEQAQKRLGLSEQDLLEKQKALLRLSIIMCVGALALCVYALYNFYTLNLKSGFISLVVMSIALVLAFRYHFWFFQIKQRKLGCSIQEWIHQGLRGGSKR